MIIIEFWKEVRGHPRFEVSNMGRVRNKKTKRILPTSPNRKGGYQRVGMDGKHQYVHRVVADTFFEGDHDNLDVNHVNGDRNDNRLPNLEWCTREENIRHAYDSGLKPSSIRIVRCKYCKNRYRYDYCAGKPDGFFCANGERE